MRQVSFALCAALLLASVAWAWGPSSHYYFTCSAADVPLSECLTSHEHLLSGTEMPDAFGFVNLLSSDGAAPVPCQDWALLAIHSPLFAGYLFQEAPRYNSATFNATEFAIGFGMHVVADGAGFIEGAYLGSGWGHGYMPLINSTTNWLSVWPFMGAVDAHVYDTYFRSTGTHLPRRGVPSNSLETAQFVVSTIQKAILNGSQFPNVDVKLVQQCATAWQSMVVEESLKVEATPAAVYQWGMIYNDQYGATNWTQAKSHFDKVRGCAIEASRKWLEAIRRPDFTPQDAVNTVMAYLIGAFSAGLCTPSA